MGSHVADPSLAGCQRVGAAVLLAWHVYAGHCELTACGVGKQDRAAFFSERQGASEGSARVGVSVRAPERAAEVEQRATELQWRGR